MYKKIYPINIATSDTDFTFEYPSPRKCPLCDCGINAQPLSSFSIKNDNYIYHVFILFFCHHCETCFMGIYTCFDPHYGYKNELRQEFLVPKGNDITSYSKNISSLSPQFIKIYNQAEQAEQWGLDEICGMGYRKSLEFLVKDFSILITPKKSEDIKIQPLGSCINDYIDSKRIKSLAKAATWLGNDETHYVRKHHDYDINTLKAFISAMVTFIDSELAYIDAEKLLSSNN